MLENDVKMTNWIQLIRCLLVTLTRECLMLPSRWWGEWWGESQLQLEELRGNGSRKEATSTDVLWWERRPGWLQYNKRGRVTPRETDQQGGQEWYSRRKLSSKILALLIGIGDGSRLMYVLDTLHVSNVSCPSGPYPNPHQSLAVMQSRETPPDTHTQGLGLHTKLKEVGSWYSHHICWLDVSGEGEVATVQL